MIVVGQTFLCLTTGQRASSRQGSGGIGQRSILIYPEFGCATRDRYRGFHIVTLPSIDIREWLANGIYANELGPQRTFPVPPSILNPNGVNTIAIAVLGEQGSANGIGSSGGLGKLYRI